MGFTRSLGEAEKALKKYFGYTSFKDGQEQVIEKILNGTDVLAVMPTGAGKSLCFQIPAVLFEGVTIVISPLISLMKDQVDALTQAGIESAYINSTVSYEDQNIIMQSVLEGRCKLLYIAPERLLNGDFLAFINRTKVSMIAVDEAHCVSHWGHDFRPGYLMIKEFIESFETRPIVSAFTATATSKVKNDIVEMLRLVSPFVLGTGFDRPNLYFGVETPSDKLSFLISYVRQKGMQSGIIYCITRKDVDAVHEELVKFGIKAQKYHAGMNEQSRGEAQDNFIFDKSQVIVATNAFGMGIDKSNIRYVLHFGMPRTIENYYQEAGRAGRDGELSECILLYAPKDIMINKFIIEKGRGESQSGEMIKLEKMINYSKSEHCLRKNLLGYFGQVLEKNCLSCSNCHMTLEESDITLEAQKILSAVKRMEEEPIKDDIISVLAGEREIPDWQKELSVHGIMSEFSEEEIMEIILHLEEKEYLSNKDGSVFLENKAHQVLRGKSRVYIRRFANKNAKTQDKESDLFRELEQLRWSFALKQKVPPYTIFSDTTLKEIASIKPKTVEILAGIHGMGENKTSKYGESILYAVAQYLEKHTPKKRKKRKSSTRTNTRMQSLELYEEGKTPKEIATLRSLNERTILSHLLECKIDGAKIEGLVQEA